MRSPMQKQKKKKKKTQNTARNHVGIVGICIQSVREVSSPLPVDLTATEPYQPLHRSAGTSLFIQKSVI